MQQRPEVTSEFRLGVVGREEKSTEWFGMNQLLLDSREIEVFYEH